MFYEKEVKLPKKIVFNNLIVNAPELGEVKEGKTAYTRNPKNADCFNIISADMVLTAHI